MSQDLIEEVLESTSTFEAPKRFYYWSTLAAISAVLKDRVWFDMAGNYKVYPNMYVLLFGPSGIRKGPAIALARELVDKVDCTRVIDGRSSIEAIISDLGQSYTRPGKSVVKDASGFVVASELSASIIGNTAAMDIMTDLYDRLYNDKDWKYRLKVSASAILKKPTITWLAGTNEALFRDFVPEKNLAGGLIGRMFVISESKKANTNSLMYKTKAPDKDKLAKILAEIAKLEGEFTTDDDNRAAINAWYDRFDKTIAPTLGDESGFVSRVLDFIIKGSIIIAAGRRQSKVFTSDDTKEAMDVILPLIVPTKKVINSVKKTDVSAITKRSVVLTYLANQPNASAERGKMLQNLGLQLDHEDLDKIAQYMIQMNVLTIDNAGGKTIFKLRLDRPEVEEFVKQFRS